MAKHTNNSKQFGPMVRTRATLSQDKPPMQRLAQSVMLAALAIGGTFIASKAFAQTAPTAGQVQRETAAPAPSVPRAAPVLPRAQEVRPQLQTASGFSMTLNGVRFTGNSQILDTDLQILIVESLGKKVGFNELQAVADTVSNYYRGKGFFVARAYLPQQEIKDGIVEISVLEGVIGANNVKQEGSVRTQAGVIQGILDANAPVGTIVHEKALERAALLANDLPGIDATVSLDPGAQTGQTNVTMTANEGRLFTATVDVDNHGNRVTGDVRLGTTFQFNSPLGLGDQATLRLMHSNKDLALIRAAYQLPVGHQGMRLGGSISRVVFTSAPIAGLTPAGDSTNITAFVQYPLERQRDRSIFLNANFDNKQQTNRNGINVGERELNVLTLGATLQSRDSIGGGGVNFANLGLGLGRLTIKDALGQAADAAGPQAAGGFSKLGMQLSRIQRLNGTFSFFGGLNAQMAWDNLDTAEKFSLGGAQGVRGYAPGEATGDMGYVAQLELRADLPVAGSTQWQAFAFYDHGGMRQDQSRYAGSAIGNTFAYTLDSAGIGLNVSRVGLFQVRALYAKALGANNGATAPLFNNVDGTRKRQRVWVQAVTQF